MAGSDASTDPTRCPYCGARPEEGEGPVCPAVLRVSGLVFFHDAPTRNRAPSMAAVTLGGGLRFPGPGAGEPVEVPSSLGEPGRLELPLARATARRRHARHG